MLISAFQHVSIISRFEKMRISAFQHFRQISDLTIFWQNATSEDPPPVKRIISTTALINRDWAMTKSKITLCIDLIETYGDL